MEQLIALVIVILLIVFIIKVGSAIWRLLGILLLAFLVWVFRAELMAQINEWARMLGSENFLEQAKQFFVSIWEKLVQWFGDFINQF
jgi:phage-related minor tail protein